MTCLLSIGLLASQACAAVPTTRPAVHVSVDTSDAPQMAAFGERVRRACEDAYPMLVAALPSDGFVPPKNVTITFRRDYKGVAECAGDRIKGSVDWFTKHPDDVGAFVHEMAHVVQHYTRGERPGWLTEGIADYARWYLYEPAKKRTKPDPAKAKYDDSYRTTAAFLDWCQTTYDPKLVAKLNAACREARYSDDLWRQYTGHPLQELGEQWHASLQNR